MHKLVTTPCTSQMPIEENIPSEMFMCFRWCSTAPRCPSFCSAHGHFQPFPAVPWSVEGVSALFAENTLLISHRPPEAYAPGMGAKPAGPVESKMWFQAKPIDSCFLGWWWPSCCAFRVPPGTQGRSAATASRSGGSSRTVPVGKQVYATACRSHGAPSMTSPRSGTASHYTILCVLTSTTSARWRCKFHMLATTHCKSPTPMKESSPIRMCLDMSHML